ncbi:hypothetical protein [Azospirillum himalayense]|uniref:Uncharacterized protein n=1 Tax=Azospirillum himalayense TaxID=654847 RepID=A0ABW0GC85_9PROT
MSADTTPLNQAIAERNSWKATCSAAIAAAGRAQAERDEARAALAAAEADKEHLRKALKRVLYADKVLGHAKDRLATVKGASDQKYRNMGEWVRRATVAMESALTDARAVLLKLEPPHGQE